MKGMYNRYIPNGAAFTRILEEDAPTAPTMTRPPHISSSELELPAVEEKKKSGLAGLLKGLKLDALDSGDIILLLILLFLFLEGDDIELVITLGLLLLLGLD